MYIFLLGIFTAVSFFLIKRYLYFKNISNKLLKAKAVEKQAELYLKQKGFKIISKQKIHYYYIIVDKKLEKFKIIPDFIVKKGREKIIVEVKYGEKASKMNFKSTRRQLLEYFLATNCKKIILLDMYNRKMSQISLSENLFFLRFLKYALLICINFLIFFFIKTF